jgi:hypothetical protein
MELNFFEMNDNNESQIDSNYEKYWQQDKPKKKKVTFDDILSNMNLVVNKSGVLQFMAPIQDDEPQEYDYNQFINKETPQQQIVKLNNNPIDPSVKHSYIYNKYFKDYNQSNMLQEPEIRVPKTMEEYKQMLLEDKIKQYKERMRIANIKSTKLMFTSPNMNTVNVNTKNIQVSKNNLRMMNFR